jgi:hypothetical protein
MCTGHVLYRALAALCITPREEGQKPGSMSVHTVHYCTEVRSQGKQQHVGTHMHAKLETSSQYHHAPAIVSSGRAIPQPSD